MLNMRSYFVVFLFGMASMFASVYPDAPKYITPETFYWSMAMLILAVAPEKIERKKDN